MRSTVALTMLAACSFDHGRPAMEDAPGGADGSQIEPDARVSDAPRDARMCAPMIGCTAFQCASTTSCYYYCTTKTTWQLAQGACDDVPNGCLVTINDQMEQDCITANVTPTFANFPWIGFRQAANGTEPAGGWSFECGTSAYVNWAMSEPDETGPEDCAAMAEGGTWFDGTCNDSGRYVCEVP